MPKWNDLSMRERRDMIRLHIKNGVTNLDEIRSSYNEFNVGGNLYGDGGSKVITYGTPIKMSKPIDKSGASEEQLYVNDWLRARKDTGNFNNQIPTPEYSRQLTNMYGSKDVGEFEFYMNLMSDNKAPKEKVANMAANEMIYNMQNGINGAYNVNRNELWANKYPEGNTHKLHETTHSLNATPQAEMISRQIPMNDEYWDDPNEIYSRLMEFRKTNNLDPKKNYNIDEIKEFKLKAKSDNLFDRYTPKQLHFLLNRVAQNETQSQRPNIAAFGGNTYGGPQPGSNQMQLSPMRPVERKIDYSFVPGKYKVPELSEQELKKRIWAQQAEESKQRQANNTTSEFINGRPNPNARMGLEIVSPEFALMTGGVGGLASKATTTAGKIGAAALHGAGQGAMANMANISGSEQNLSGLATDVLGGAAIGGGLKGIGLKIKPTDKYVLQKSRPYLPDEKSIPMIDSQINSGPGEAYLRSVKAREVELSKQLQSGSITFDDLTNQIQSYKQKLSKDLGFGEKLGEGKYGEVFELSGDTNDVIKLGNPFGNKWTPELIESLSGLRNSGNIAIPKEVSYLNIPSEYAGYSPSVKEIVKMPNLNKSNFEKLDLDKRNRYALFLKQVRQLRDKGIAVDADNLENFKFNPEKNVFDIYDVNPSHINNPGAYMRYVVGKTKNSLLDSMQYRYGGFIK